MITQLGLIQTFWKWIAWHLVPASLAYWTAARVMSHNARGIPSMRECGDALRGWAQTKLRAR